MTTPNSSSNSVAAVPPSNEFMDKLKTFVRTEGSAYLQDKNITSVGIGYKQTSGQTTPELAIQFTVGQKAVPEELDDMGTMPIPKAFSIDGVTVPTDVIERNYKPAYKIVAETETSPRKMHVNPIVPGISVAHRKVSAGTIGCIVYDRHTGRPYILSNWHVLHGPLGNIGDEIVQPGPHDDNRLEQNRLGTLVRSHLGQAGDCAIATIEDRAFRPDIFDLHVVAKEIGEAELNDRVIKSGRTTGVTHGIVTRVNTIVRLDYGGAVGERDIGGFEIGPDPQHMPDNGEISMGGDSGAVWLFRSADGATTSDMAGLHFAGESSADTNEHALACYPRSVFEKLEISLSPLPARPDDADVDVVLRRGYDSEFIGPLVPAPTLSETGKSGAFLRDGSELIPYTHFSLALNASRGFAIWVAWNIDGGRLRKLSRKGVPFALAPDIPSRFQVDDTLYAGNRLDRGHIARRADLCWGSEKEARQANRESFFFTNITPQMDDFNQSAQGGIWGGLEDAVFDEVDVQNLRISVFGGPLFRDDDQEYRGIKIPRAFYKVLAYVEGGRVQAKAFLLTQNLDELEMLDFDGFKVFQVTLAELETRSEVRFPEVLKSADAFAALLENSPETARERKPIESLAQIRW